MEITSQRKIERTSPNYFRPGDLQIVGGLKQGAFVCPVLIMASLSPLQMVLTSLLSVLTACLTDPTTAAPKYQYKC